MDIQLIRPFGPAVAKVKMPTDLVEKLNNYIDEVVSNKEKSIELNHGKNLVGDVTQEFKLDKEIIDKSNWGDFVSKSVYNWVHANLKKKITKFEIQYTWIVRQFKHEYNPTHWHSGHISGAGFLKVPSSLGKHYQNKTDKQYRGGSLQLLHGARMFLCPSTLNIIPQVGDLYLFPNYLMHTVFPFKNTDEERRSISFNAKIDDNIYDAYG